jgi:hypothetical protein
MPIHWLHELLKCLFAIHECEFNITKKNIFFSFNIVFKVDEEVHSRWHEKEFFVNLKKFINASNSRLVILIPKEQENPLIMIEKQFDSAHIRWRSYILRSS